MAHRGRLSVLAHNLGRSGGVDPGRVRGGEGPRAGEGDRGDPPLPARATSSTTTAPRACSPPATATRSRCASIPNPSHLEFVDPVVTGGARAAQTSRSGPRLDHKPALAVPLLLHGDAAFPGQGVVAETLNLQSLAGYSTGGTVHIITDNQVGFTTDPEEARSTPYAQRPREGLQRADRPRQRRRRRGLHRGDPPRDGLPRALGPRRGHRPDRLSPLRPQRDRRARLHPAHDGGARIKAHPPVSEIYAEQLVKEGVVTREEVEGEGKERRDELQRTLKELRRKMESGEYEDPTSTQVGTGELDRTQEPRGRDRRLRGSPALAQRGAAQGSRRASRSTASCASR